MEHQTQDDMLDDMISSLDKLGNNLNFEQKNLTSWIVSFVLKGE